jgi:Transaldolase/Fructose-6-phosphate aldolase
MSTCPSYTSQEFEGETMMAINPLHTLEQCGQSIWLDSLSRGLIHAGTLLRLVQEDGIGGVTANPSIFEKAIVGSHDYDESIRAPDASGRPPIRIYEDLAIQDVGAAADILRAAYDRRETVDGPDQPGWDGLQSAMAEAAQDVDKSLAPIVY